MSRRREIEAAEYWYSRTESKIHSEARDRGEKGDKISDSQIKINEERLRKKYYRDTPSQKDINKNMSRDEYYEGLEKIKEKLRGK